MFLVLTNLCTQPFGKAAQRAGNQPSWATRARLALPCNFARDLHGSRTIIGRLVHPYTQVVANIVARARFQGRLLVQHSQQLRIKRNEA
jgi:hypothetical protein